MAGCEIDLGFRNADDKNGMPAHLFAGNVDAHRYIELLAALCRQIGAERIWVVNALDYVLREQVLLVAYYPE